MSFALKTKSFRFEYNESEIDSIVLWESHCHSQFEMIGVLEGDIMITLEGKKYRVSQGQSVMITPLSYHTITANKKGCYRRLTTLFDASAIPEEIRAYFTVGESEIFIASSHQLERLMNICKEEDPSLYHPLAEALMIEVFYEALRASQSGTAAETDEFLQSAIGYIEEHIGEMISLESLAKHTSRSPSSFSHLFEAKMGISPKQYILQKKFALANKMINDGVPPTIAAIKIGYENYSNFYRIYRRYFGKSPAR